MNINRTIKILGLMTAIFAAGTFSVSAMPSQDEINIVSGDVSFDRTDSTLTVNVGSEKAIIEMDSFNVAKGEHVFFSGSNSELLARVTGGSASFIDGNITSDLLLLAFVNPAGINIGPDAAINANNLIMSTRDISDMNFMNDNFVFEKTPGMENDMLLLNRGKINITYGGFGVFIAGAVENRGVITARAGTIALAGGDAIKLDVSNGGLISVAVTEKTASQITDYDGNSVLDQIKNSGTLNADGGNIIVRAESLTDIFRNAINLEGHVSATRIEEKDGHISLVADGEVKINTPLYATNIVIETNKVRGAEDIVHTAGETVHVTAAMVDIISTSETTHFTVLPSAWDIPEEDVVLTIEEITHLQENFVILDLGDVGKIGYITTNNITFEVPRGTVNTAPGVNIPGNQVKVSARKFGSLDVPLGIDADTTYINRISGTIDITEMWGLGSTICIRGPAPSDTDGYWGAVSYRANTHLKLFAESVRFFSDFPDFIHAEPQSLEFWTDVEPFYFFGDLTIYSIDCTSPWTQFYFEPGSTITLLGSATISTDINSSIILRSNRLGEQWKLNVNTNEYFFSGLLVQDSIGSSPDGDIYVHPGSNWGNNSGWDINTKTWIRSGTQGDWSSGANWSGGVSPASGDHVVFDGSGNADCSLNTNATLTHLFLDAEYTGTLRFTTWSDRTLTVTSTVQLDGGTIHMPETAYSSNFDISDGDLLVRGGILRMASGHGGELPNLFGSNTVTVTNAAVRVFDGAIIMHDTKGSNHLKIESTSEFQGTPIGGSLYVQGNVDITDSTPLPRVAVRGGSLLEVELTTTVGNPLGTNPESDPEEDYEVGEALNSAIYVVNGGEAIFHDDVVINSGGFISLTLPSTENTSAIEIAAGKTIANMGILGLATTLEWIDGASPVVTGSIECFGGTNATIAGNPILFLTSLTSGWTAELELRLKGIKLDNSSSEDPQVIGEIHRIYLNGLPVNFGASFSYGSTAIRIMDNNCGFGDIAIKTPIDVEYDFSRLHGNDKSFTVSGNWTMEEHHTARFDPGTGTVTFDGTGEQKITSGGTAETKRFNAIAYTGSGTLVQVGSIHANIFHVFGIGEGEVILSEANEFTNESYGVQIYSNGKLTIGHEKALGDNPLVFNTATKTLKVSKPGGVVIENDLKTRGTILLDGDNDLTVNGTILTTGDTIFNVGGGLTLSLLGGITYVGVASWERDITKTGAGILTLGGGVKVMNMTISGGILNASPGTMEIGQSWSSSGGIFNHNGGKVILNRTASGTLNINSGGVTNQFYDLSIELGATRTVTLQTNNLAVANDLEIKSGTFDANGRTVSVTGLTTVSGGTYQAKTGTQTFTGGLTVSGTGVFTGSTGGVTVSGNLAFSSSGTFTAPSGAFSVAGNWSRTGSGTFSPGTGTVTFNGTGTQTITTGGTSFNNVNFSNSSGQINYTGALAVVGTTVLSQNTSLISTNNSNVTFTSTINGARTLTVNAGTGTVTFGGVIGGSTALTSLTVNSANQVTFSGNVTTTGVQDITATTIRATATHTTTNSDITFDGNVTLLGNVTLTTGAGAGTIEVTGTTNGSGARTLGLTAGTGNISFSGAVGNSTALTSLTVNSANQVTFSGNVTTTGVQDITATTIRATATHTTTNSDIAFDGNVTLLGNVTLTTGAGAGTIEVTGTVDGTNDLSLNAGEGTIEFGDDVGDSEALGDINIENCSTATFSGSLSAASYQQNAGNVTFNENVILSGNLTINGGILTAPGTGKGFFIAGNWTNTGMFTHNSGTVTFTGTTAGNEITTSTDGEDTNAFHNISFDGGVDGNWTLQDNMLVTGTFSATGGEFISGPNTVSIIGASAQYIVALADNIDLSSGSTLIVRTDYDEDISLPENGVYGNLTLGRFSVNGAPVYIMGSTIKGDWTIEEGATVKMSDDVKVEFGSVVIEGTLETEGYDLEVEENIEISGTLDATGVIDPEERITVITLYGNWTKSGTFTYGDSEVVFAGSGESIISGNTTFWDFTCVEHGKTLSFESEKTQTIKGTWQIVGGDGEGEKITLRRNGGGGDDQWEVDPQGEINIDYVIVSNSNNLNEEYINPDLDNSVDDGNNTFWWQYGVEISGMIADADGNEIVIYINGDKISKETISEGTFTFPVITVEENDVILIFVVSDGSELYSTLVGIVQNSDDAITGLDLKLDFVTLGVSGGKLGETITNSDLADGIGAIADDDILYTVSEGVVTFTQGVFIPASMTYAPGADIFVGGNWESNGAFTPGTHKVTFVGETEITGTGDHTFNDIVIEENAELTIAENALLVNGDATVSGTVSISTGEMIVKGAWDGIGGTITFTETEGSLVLEGEVSVLAEELTDDMGTVVYAGTTEQTIDINVQYYNLTISNTAGGNGASQGEGKLVAGTITISDSATFTALNEGEIEIWGNWINNGTFNHNEGTVFFDGEYDEVGGVGEQLITGAGDHTFYNIEIGGDALLVAPDEMTVTGNWTNNGTFTPGTYTVIFDGDEPQLITGGGDHNFHDIVIGEDAEIVAPSGIDGNLYISGNWTNNRTFTHNGGTVVFSPASASTISGPTTFYNFECIAPGKTLRFEEGKTQIILNRIILKGGSGGIEDLLTIRSTSEEGQRASIILDSGSQAEHPQDIEHVEVKDIDSDPGHELIAVGLLSSIDNTVNWKLSNINSWTDLNNVRNYPDRVFYLGSDLDSETSGYLELGNNFQPIPGFEGVFDGQGYTISDLVIDIVVGEGDPGFIGLFGSLGDEGSVSNLTLSNAGIEVTFAAGYDEFDAFVGGLVGETSGTLENSGFEGRIEVLWESGGSHQSLFIGGIAGVNHGIITSSHTICEISVIVSDIGTLVCGGAVGLNFGDISGSYSNSLVHSVGTGRTEDFGTGGFVGANVKDGDGGTISFSYASGRVVSVFEGDEIVSMITGGFAGGNLYAAEINDSYSRTTVLCVLDDSSELSAVALAGGFLGDNSGTFLDEESDGDWGIITNCYSTGFVYSCGESVSTGGLVALNGQGTVTDSYWDILSSGQTESDGGTGKTTSDMMKETTFDEWDMGDIDWWDPHDKNFVWNIISDLEHGGYYPLLSWQDPAQAVQTWADLDAIRDGITGIYVLISDLDSSTSDYLEYASSQANDGAGWIPVEHFSGILDGKGHSISDLYVDNEELEFAGLFSEIGSSGQVNSIVLDTADVSGKNVTGVLAGLNAGSIYDIYVSGIVESVISGGVVGINYGVIYLSHADANVSSVSDSSGLIGAGGFVGINWGGLIVNSWTRSIVSGDVDTGDQAIVAFGGFSGANTEGGRIIGSFSMGTVYAELDLSYASSLAFLGGFSGVNAEDSIIESAYSTGNIRGIGTGFESLGGFVGVNAGIILNVYSTGYVNYEGEDEPNVGGLVSLNDGGTVISSYWDTLTSGYSESDGGVGKITPEMMEEVTFSDWDFEKVWGMVEAGTYPYLMWAYPETPTSVSGIVYSDVGETPAGPNEEVVLAIEGTNISAAFTGHNGFYYFLVPSEEVSLGNTVLVYLNEDGGEAAFKGNSFTLAPETMIAEFDIYADTLRLAQYGETVITNTSLASGWMDSENILYNVDGSSKLILDAGLYIEAGCTYAPGGDIEITGDWHNEGVFDPGSGTVMFDGTTQIFGDAEHVFYSVIINDGATLIGPPEIEIEIEPEEFEPEPGEITVVGNWTNDGTFDHNDGRVTFVGVDAIIETGGDGEGKSFYELNFGDDSVVTVTGDLRVEDVLVIWTTGTITFEGDVMVEHATYGPSACFFVEGTIDIENNTLKAGPIFVVNLGGNDRIFSIISGGGRIETETIVVASDLESLTEEKEDRFSQTLDLSGFAGEIEVNMLAILGDGPIGEAMANGLFEESGADHFYGHGIIDLGDSGNAVELNIGRMEIEIDEVTHYYSVYIETTEGATDNEIRAGDSEWVLEGSWYNDGIFDSETSTVIFAGEYDEGEESGEQFITGAGDHTFHNIEIGGSALLVGPSDVDGDLFISGNWTNSGTFTHDNGTVVFDGNAAQTISGENTWYDLNIVNTGVEVFVTANDVQTVENSLTITEGHFKPYDGDNYHDVIIAAGGVMTPEGDITVSGDWTNSGTFTHGSNKVTFDGEAGQAIGGENIWYYLTIDNTGNIEEDEFVIANAKQTVTNSLTITEGHFKPHNGDNYHDVIIAAGGVMTPEGDITVSGDWTNSGTYIHNGGKVTFNGTSVVMGTEVTSFNDITIMGELTGHETNMNVSGDWENDGTFTHNGGKVTFNGTSVVMGTEVTSFNDITIMGELTGHETNMNVSGNWTNEGMFIHNFGTVIFNGLENIQEIGKGNHTIFWDLVIIKEKGELTVNNSIEVLNVLALENSSDPWEEDIVLNVALPSGSLSVGNETKTGYLLIGENCKLIAPGLNHYVFNTTDEQLFVNNGKVEMSAPYYVHIHANEEPSGDFLITPTEYVNSLIVINHSEYDINCVMASNDDLEVGWFFLSSIEEDTRLTMDLSGYEGRISAITVGLLGGDFSEEVGETYGGVTLIATDQTFDVGKEIEIWWISVVVGEKSVLDMGNSTWNVLTDWYNFGTVIPGASSVNFIGDTEITNTGTLAFYDLAIDNEKVLTAPSEMSVFGSWSNDGTFFHNDGKVIFNPGEEPLTILGSTTFYDFECKTPGGTLIFEAGKTQTVANTLTLEGFFGDNLKIKSSDNGIMAYIDLLEPALQNLRYLEVTDNQAIGQELLNRGSGSTLLRTINWSLDDGVAIWLGTVSNNWGLGENWDINMVPDAGHDLLFEPAEYDAILDTDRTALSITIAEGAELSLGAHTLNVTGNWTNNGAFNAGEGKVIFSGTESGKSIMSGGDWFYDISFKGPGGEWTIQDDLFIERNFIVTDGKFISGNNTVTIEGASASYMNGNINASNTDWTGGTLNIFSDIGQELPENEIYNVLRIGRHTSDGEVTIYAMGENTQITRTQVQGGWIIDADARVLLNVTWTGKDRIYDGTENAGVTYDCYHMVAGFYEDFDLDYTALFDNKNVGGDKAISVTEISITGNDASKYILASGTGETTANITPRFLDFSEFEADDKVYDGTTEASGIEFSDDRINGDILEFTYSAAFDEKNVGEREVVISGITISGGADKDNYKLASNSGVATANITVRTLVLSDFTAGNKTYDGTKEVTGTGFSDDRIAGDILEFTYDAEFEDKNAGLDKDIHFTNIVISGGVDQNNYTLASNTGVAKADISPRTLILSDFTSDDKTYDGNTDVLSGTGFDDNRVAEDVLEFTYDVEFEDKNAGVGKAVNFTNIVISGGADKDNYILASTIGEASADITARELTIDGSFTAENKTYDGSVEASMDTNDLNLTNAVVGDDISLADITIEFTGEGARNAGEGKIVEIVSVSLGGDDKDNYTVSLEGSPTSQADISPKEITIDGNFYVANKVYDGTISANIIGNELVLEGVISGDDVALDPVAVFEDAEMGKNKTVNISDGSSLFGTDSANYSLSFFGAPTTTARIFPDGLIELTVINVTVMGKTYDGHSLATIDLTDAQFSGVIPGEDVTIITAEAVGYFADKNAGTGKKVTIVGIEIGGDDADHYYFNDPEIFRDITPKPVTLDGTFEVEDKVYDGTFDAVVSENSLTIVGMIAEDDISVMPEANFSDKNVGDGIEVVLTANTFLAGGDSGNYELSIVGAPTAAADIKPLELSIGGSFTAKNKIYDGNVSAHMFADDLTLVTAIQGDDVELANVVIEFADKNAAGGIEVNIVSADLSGDQMNNYTLNVSGSPVTAADITPKELIVVNAEAQNKVYDGTIDAVIEGAVLDGVIGGDTVILQDHETGTFDSRHVGDVIAVTTNMSITGDEAENYFLTQPFDLKADITPLPITLTAQQDTKVYDGTVSSNVPPDITSGSLASGDTSGFYQVFDNKNAGENKTLYVLGMVNDGNNGNNYDVTFVANVEGKITPRLLTVSGHANNKVYDGNNKATVNFTDDRIAGDEIFYTYTAVFPDRHAGTDKDVDVWDIEICNANYYLESHEMSLSANITPLVLEEFTPHGSIWADDKIYDGTANAVVHAAHNAWVKGVYEIDDPGVGVVFDFSGIGGTFEDAGNQYRTRTVKVNITGVLITGEFAGNYTLSLTTQASITTPPDPNEPDTGGPEPPGPVEPGIGDPSGAEILFAPFYVYYEDDYDDDWRRRWFARGRYRTVVIVYEGRVVAAPYDETGTRYEYGVELEGGESAAISGDLI